jgi:hypothetical protein
MSAAAAALSYPSAAAAAAQSRSAEHAARLMCASIRASAACLFKTARVQNAASKSGLQMLEHFAASASQPVVADFALQLLASHCVIMHTKLAQLQQQEQQQQGRRMRRA